MYLKLVPHSNSTVAVAVVEEAEAGSLYLLLANSNNSHLRHMMKARRLERASL